MKQGLSQPEAEDRAVELILAPADGREFSDNPPNPVPNELRDQIEERLELIEDALNKALDRMEKNKVVRLRPKSKGKSR